MLGHGGLGNAELVADGRAEGAGGLLAAGEQFQDAAPDRIAQHVEGVHDDLYITAGLFKPELMNR